MRRLHYKANHLIKIELDREGACASNLYNSKWKVREM